MTPDIQPDRNNWRLFCEEPELTPEEWATWYELAATVRGQLAQGDEALFDFLQGEIEEEHREYREASKVRTADWSDMVASSDAFRRYRRAELAAYERWQ